MTKYLLTIMLFTNMAFGKSLKVFHYNIKELDSTKIENVDRQVFFVKNILSRYDFDFLSLNEIQYDFKNIPNPNYQTKGQNIRKLLKIWDLKNLDKISFNPANTGLNAKPKKDGTYYSKPNSQEARSHADQVNFGTFPGQYSTAGATKLNIISEKVINDLKWKDFNPNLDLSKYKTASGENLPEDMPLFDKNFSDITIKFNDKEVHMILLHTVPSYHFGNMKSVNMYRNEQQLKFLEWYLTGNTDFQVKIKGIAPLRRTDRFIAMGDFNIDINESSKPGAQVMLRIFSKAKPWIDPSKMNFSNESGGFAKDPNRLMLDYMVVSKNIKIKKAKIVHPDFKRVDLGCDTDIATSENNMVKVQYKKNGEICHALITKEYHLFKLASDHYPILGEFEI